MSEPTTTRIKTRILIISDTHGVRPKHKVEDPSTEDELSKDDVMWVKTGYREPLAEADVVLHCGDLTKRSTIPEFQTTFSMLRGIRAPLKLAIAGNHDLVLDEDFWRDQWGGHQDAVTEARKIIVAAKEDGVHYLEEGVHEFDLENGARLRVYASPYTPVYGGWAFQYYNGHNFDIPSDVDVAMTHGPPRGVLDLASMTETHAGCGDLFEAVHRAKPKIHCFGHIHEAWGAHLVRWKEGDDGSVRSKSVIDAENSPQIKLAGLRPNPKIYGEEKSNETRERLIEMSKQRGLLVDLTEGMDKLAEGEQTLFVNAAIMDIRYRPIQMPWLIDVNLPKTESK
ncbi:Fc.00g037760.m01.CDS01 [Cosmosporella sp. VM-42]